MLSRRLSFLLMLYGISIKINGQVLFLTPYESESDLKVWVSNSLSDADLLVYKVENITQSTEDGLWYFTNVRAKAKKKIYFVNTITKADLKTYYVNNLSQRGWRNLSKKYLLN